MRVGRVAVSCLRCRSIPQQETATRPTGNGNLVAIDRTATQLHRSRLHFDNVPVGRSLSVVWAAARQTV